MGFKTLVILPKFPSDTAVKYNRNEYSYKFCMKQNTIRFKGNDGAPGGAEEHNDQEVWKQLIYGVTPRGFYWNSSSSKSESDSFMILLKTSNGFQKYKGKYFTKIVAIIIKIGALILYLHTGETWDNSNYRSYLQVNFKIALYLFFLTFRTILS